MYPMDDLSPAAGSTSMAFNRAKKAIKGTHGNGLGNGKIQCLPVWYIPYSTRP